MIRYHALYAANSDKRSFFSLSLRVPAPLATYYVQLLARSFSVRSRDKYPRATTTAANSSEVERHFCAGHPRRRISNSRFPARSHERSITFVTRGTHPQLFIAFTPAIRSLSLVRTRRCCTPAAVRHSLFALNIFAYSL